MLNHEWKCYIFLPVEMNSQCFVWGKEPLVQEVELIIVLHEELKSSIVTTGGSHGLRKEHNIWIIPCSTALTIENAFLYQPKYSLLIKEQNILVDLRFSQTFFYFKQVYNTYKYIVSISKWISVCVLHLSEIHKLFDLHHIHRSIFTIMFADEILKEVFRIVKILLAASEKPHTGFA